MLLSHDTRQFFGTTESPSATPNLDSGAYRPVPVLNHRPTLLGLMISFMVQRVDFPNFLLPWATPMP